MYGQPKCDYYTGRTTIALVGLSGIVGGLQVHYAVEARPISSDKLGHAEDQWLIEADGDGMVRQAGVLNAVAAQDGEGDRADGP